MADKDRGEQNAETAFEQGYMGVVHDPIDNDAYTVQGQGADTARREREAREQLRSERIKASRDEGTTSSRKSSSRKSSASSSSSSGSASSS